MCANFPDSELRDQIMHAGGTCDPDEATKERLMANTQRLLYNMVKMKRQKEGEPPPTKLCITGGDGVRVEGDSANGGNAVGAKNVGAQCETKGEASTTKYRLPEVIQMRMSGFPALEKLKPTDGSKVVVERSGGGLKRAIDGEVKGVSANKRRKVSKNVEGIDSFAVSKRVEKSGVQEDKMTQSEGDGKVRMKIGKQPVSSVTVGGKSKQLKADMTLNRKGSKDGKVKGVRGSKPVTFGQVRKVGRPRSKHAYPPTKQILGETPLGDQTW